MEAVQELDQKFELLEPFSTMPNLSHLIEQIVTDTVENRIKLFKGNTFMRKGVNEYLTLENVTYQTTFWHIFCAYGLIDCVERFAAHMKGKKELVTVNDEENIRNTALILATRYNHLPVVAKLLETQKIAAEEASQALVIAAANNNLSIAKLLLKVPGIDLYQGSRWPLEWAIEQNNYQLAKALLLAGAEILKVQQDGEKEIDYREATDPKLIALLLLFDRSPTPCNTSDIDTRLAKKVLIAVQRVKYDITKSIIKSANDQQAYNIGISLLSEVLDLVGEVAQQWQVILRHLGKITKGVLGTYQFTAFDLQLLDLIYLDDYVWKNLELTKPQTDNPKQLPTLILESLCGNKQESTALEIDTAPPITIVIKEPFKHAEDLFELYKAILSNPPELILRSLDTERMRRVLMNHANHPTGIRPIHIFCAYGMTACAEKMIELGDDPEALMHTSHAYTPLMLAVLYGHHATVRLLLNHRVKLFHRDLMDNPDAQTPLEIAAWNNDLDMIKIILAKQKQGPDFRYHDSRATALFAAVDNANVEMCRVLLNAGADPHLIIPNCNNLSPFELASVNESHEIITLFNPKNESSSDFEEHCDGYTY